MSVEFIHVHSMPKNAVPMNGFELEEHRRNTRAVYQLAGCMSRLEALFNRAEIILNCPDDFDFEEDVPAVMSEIYLIYLRMGAIRKYLDITRVSKEVAAVMPDILAAQSSAEKYLDILSALFNEEAVFGISDEDPEEGADEDTDNDDGDHLCVINIEMSDEVPPRVKEAIYKGIDTVVSTAFKGLDVEIS